jgi:hypothetical protein
MSFAVNNIVIPYGVTRIETMTFECAQGLTNITLPNTITSIGWAAFGETGFTDIDFIPNSVTHIEGEAFSGSLRIANVVIPSSVVSIGEGAFRGNGRHLVNITVENGNQHYVVDGNSLIRIATNELIAGTQHSTIPNYITRIGVGAFGSLRNVSYIAIPNSVISIGRSAFSYSELRNVIIPSSVSDIETLAFLTLSMLESITIDENNLHYRIEDNSIIRIADNTLIQATRLSTGVPDGVTAIADLAFLQVDHIFSIIIPNTVETIGASAFSGLQNIRTAFIPSSVTTIGDRGFGGNPNLTIYAEPLSQPPGWQADDGWFFSWNHGTYSVIWGASPPAIIELVSPHNGATGVSLNPTLTWETIENVSSIEVWLGQNSFNLQLVATINDGTATSWTSMENQLFFNARYFWQIRGIGSSVLYSPEWSFTTNRRPPDTPSPVSPPPHSINQPLRPTLEWFMHDYSLVDGFYIYVGNSVNPADDEDNLIDTVTDTEVREWTFTTDLEYDTTYYWAIVAFNEGGRSHAYTWVHFTTQVALPGQVELSEPEDGAVGVPIIPTLVWNQPSGTVVGYYIYFGRYPNPANDEENLAHTTNETSWTRTLDLAYDTTYHWQVVAYNDTGRGVASESWSFTTQIAPPGHVALDLPENGAVGVPIRPTLIWIAPTETVSGYHVYLGISENPANDETNFISTVNETSWTFETDLDFETTYHWQIVPFNATGNGIASSSWRFTTQIAPPGQVVLATPFDEAVGVPLRPTLTWQTPTIGGVVTGYYVYKCDTVYPPFDIDNPMTRRVAELDATATSWTIGTDLEHENTYHWQIVAFNSTGKGEASNAWSFTTERKVYKDDEVYRVYRTALIGNSPNPFNPETTIRFEVQGSRFVHIEIYNIRGQLVRTLVNDYHQQGVYSVDWDGRDDNGNHASSGIYLYRMVAGEYVSVRRMVLMK